MEYRNNLVGTPVKTYDVNALISEVNHQLARPCLYTYLFMGMTPQTAADIYDETLVHPIHLPMKQAPRITVEVSSVGARPNDFNKLIADSGGVQRLPVSYFISPYVVISKTAGTVFSKAPENSATRYCNYGLTRSIPIEVGSILTMRPQVDSDLFNEHTGNYLQDYALWFGLAFVAPGNSILPIIDEYKQASTPPKHFYAPWFTLNIIVDYEEAL